MIEAVLFDFSGVLINDEPIHRQLIDEILVSENLRPKPEEYRQACLGRSDRACINTLLENRGRVVSDSYLTQLVSRKAQAYEQQLEKLEKLPLYPGVNDLIFKLRVAKLKMVVVSGALRSEVELVLNRANLAQYFTAIVTGDDITATKPESERYLLAIERLNQTNPDLNIQASQCLAIEDTPAGILAAKRAGVAVVGVAHTYPFHMLQRQANWAVDYLSDLEIERVQQVYSQKQVAGKLA